LDLSTIVFHMDSQPDFNRLKAKGWYHPLGLGNEELQGSLTKEFGGYEISVVHHHFRDTFSYTEAFLYYKRGKPVIKKGEGKGMSREAALKLINFLYDEMADNKEETHEKETA